MFKFAQTALLVLGLGLSPVIMSLDFNQQEMLDTHNFWRAKLGLPALTYSVELAKSAQTWAKHLQQSNQCKMEHSQGKFGENLFWGSAWSDGRVQDISAKLVVDSWASEKADFSYSDNSCTRGKMCGHYTQLVWKNTARVGCAATVCANNHSQIWVCQYDPPGNYIGQKPY